MIDYYSKPILTARETARYLGMPESTLDVWLLDRGKPPLVHAVQPERRGWPRVPFVGVIGWAVNWLLGRAADRLNRSSGPAA